jgi:hypothetical protein
MNPFFPNLLSNWNSLVVTAKQHLRRRYRFGMPKKSISKLCRRPTSRYAAAMAADLKPDWLRIRVNYVEYSMTARVRLKQHPAIKHGAYSAIGLLPGEDRAGYEKLHRELTAKYLPDGPLENHIVADLTRYIWRSKNLSTLRIAKLARQPFIREERPTSSYSTRRIDIEEIQAAQCAAVVKDEDEEAAAREELGELYELLAVGEIATIPYLERELTLQAFLDAKIDTCLKRLLHAKGLSSITVSPSAPVQRLSAPPKAA